MIIKKFSRSIPGLIVLSAMIQANVAYSANFNHNAIGVGTGQSYLSSTVVTVSDNISINDADRFSSVQYLRHLNREVAVEFAAMNFGTVRLTGPAGEQFFIDDGQRVDLSDNALFQVSTKSFAVSGVFRTWMTRNFAAAVRLGAHRWQRTVEYQNLINSPNWTEKDTGVGLLWSLGMVYAVSNLQFELRVGSAHIGNDAIKHSQHGVFSINYGFL